MKFKNILVSLTTIILLISLNSGSIQAQIQSPTEETSPQAVLGTGFTYQGHLIIGDQPANGSFDFEFGLYSKSNGGNPIAGHFKEDVSVSEGLLTVELDFPAGIFKGNERWLQINVRPGNETGAYIPLSPRQKITATPNSLFARLAGSVPWSGLTGVPEGFADGVDDSTDTTYSAGTGLSLNGTVFSVEEAFQLPQACSGGQIAEWNNTSSTWECAADDASDTTYTAGDGLSLVGTEFSVVEAYQMPQACSDGQIAEWNNTLAYWQCAANDDTDTTYTAGDGLSLSGTEFSADFAGSGSATTSARSDHDHSGVYASTSHDHDDLYYTETELGTSGSATIHWDNLSSVPAGFADGVDDDTDTTYTAGSGLSLSGTQFNLEDAYQLPQACSNGQIAEWNDTLAYWECAADDDTDTTYTAGDGLSLTGTEFSADFAGSGSAATSARSDHDHSGVYASTSHAHDDLYYTETELQTSGSSSVHWDNLSNVPVELSDGDDDTTYTAGSGLSLSGTEFSVEEAFQLPQACSDGQIAKWNDTLAAWECAADDATDTTYTAGSGLSLSGTEFSVDTSAIQARVIGECAVGSTIRVINADGSVECQADKTGNRSTMPSDTESNTLDGGISNVGQHTSVTIGTDGLGLISYYDVTNGDLMVAHCSDVACSGTTNTTLDNSGNVGMYTSIILGADGMGLISYYDATNGNLKVAHCSDTECSSATIAVLDNTANAGQYTSIMIGTDGFGLISYYDVSNDDLKVAHCNNQVCSNASLTTLDAGTVGQYTAIIIGADGLGLIGYYGTGTGLKVAHCADTACTSTTKITILEGTPKGQYGSMTLGVDGLGLISYFDGVSKLKVAHCSDVECGGAVITDIDASGNVGYFTSITIGLDELGIISYYDRANGDLKVAHCNNTTCTTATLNTLASAGNIGHYTAITIGADGLPLISYYDATNGDLKSAHCSNGFCVPYFRRR